MRESRTYGSGRGACHEMHVPTATHAREFITLLGGTAAAWPLVARAQQAAMRRIGVLWVSPRTIRKVVLALRHWPGLYRIWAGLKDTISGTDYRWAAGDIERTHILATELVRSAPDAIVVNTPPGLSALQGKTHTIPIVFDKSSMLPRAPS